MKDKLISLNAAIDIINKMPVIKDNNSMEFIEKSLTITKIKLLPSVTPKEQRWIPVSEKLPEDDVYVLLTVRRMDDSYNHVPFISTGYISWNHQCWWCAHDGNCKDANIDVLAWMPLPEPYREEGENDV